MFETILLIIIGVILFMFVVSLMLSLSPDFLLWGAGKDNPKWKEEYDKHLSDFLRLKRQGNSTDWGV